MYMSEFTKKCMISSCLDESTSLALLVALLVMTKATLWLTNEAKSGISDIIGQNVKEKEVRVEVDVVCLGEIILCESQDWEQGSPGVGERVLGVLSISWNPWKGCSQMWP